MIHFAATHPILMLMLAVPSVASIGIVIGITVYEIEDILGRRNGK